MHVNRKISTKRHYVLHNYHDHAFDQDVDSSMVSDDPCSGSEEEEEEEHIFKRTKHVQRKRRGPRGGVAVPFPEKLHHMLARADRDGHAHVVSWQPHGRCFLLHKPKQFVTDVMPKFFKQSKLTSFQRQLNLYGFSRLTSGPDRGAYYHELFLRGKEFLCKNMIRTRIKGTGIKAASSPATEPNFYIMPAVPAAGEEEDEEVKDNKYETAPDKVSSASSTSEPDETSHVVWPEPSDAVLSAEIPLLPPLTISAPTSSTPPPPPTGVTAVPVTPSISPHQVMPPPPKLPSDLMLTSPSSRPPPPPPPIHDNDEVLFEGQVFHYLDSAALEGLSLNATTTTAPSAQLLDCDTVGLPIEFENDQAADLAALEDNQLVDMLMY